MMVPYARKQENTHFTGDTSVPKVKVSKGVVTTITSS